MLSKQIFAIFVFLAIVLFISGGVSSFAKVQEPFFSEVNFKGSLSQTRCIQPQTIDQYNPQTNWCGKDEWLEIYNPTSENLNLNGWKIELRHGKTIFLSGSNLPGNGFLVVGFSQQNFQSVVLSQKLQNYNLLYLSNDSEAQPEHHEIKAVLYNHLGEVVDFILSHPSLIDPNYIESRGQSYERCLPNGRFMRSSLVFYSDGGGNNLGTPGSVNSSCQLPVAEILSDSKIPLQQEVQFPSSEPSTVEVEVANPATNPEVETLKQTELKQDHQRQILEISPRTKFSGQASPNPKSKFDLRPSPKDVYSNFKILNEKKNLNTHSNSKSLFTNKPLQNVFPYEYTNFFGMDNGFTSFVINLPALTGLLIKLITCKRNILNNFFYASKFKKHW